MNTTAQRTTFPAPPRMLLLAVRMLPLAALLAALPVRMAAQNAADLHVSNDGYAYRVTTVQGMPLFVVDGFTCGTEETPALPSRIVRIPLGQGGATRYAVGRVLYGASFTASPYVRTLHTRQGDSLISTAVVPIQPPAASGDVSRPSVLSQRSVIGRDAAYVELQVPLCAYDAASNTVRWIESLDLIPDGSAGGSVPVTESPLPTAAYAELPFLRDNEDLDTSGAWLSGTQTPLRFFVRSDGLYRVSRGWLAAAGMQLSGLDPSQLHLFRKGVEVPMLAVGMDDGSMDDGDYFLFNGERNYPLRPYRSVPGRDEIDKPYPQYLGMYGDSVAYWFVVSAQQPLRVTDAAYQGPPPAEQLDWYYDATHVEQDTYLQPTAVTAERKENPLWTSEDTWIAGWFHPGATANVAFTADSVKPGIGTRVWGKFISWYGESGVPSHRVRVALNNGAALDSVTFIAAEQGLLHATAPPEDLVEGANAVKFTSVNILAGSSDLVADWYDVEYPRKLTAKSGGLTFRIDSAMGEDPRRIRMTGFLSSDIVALRLRGTIAERMTALAYSAGAPYEITFDDTLETGTRYVLASLAAIPEPAAGAKVLIDDFRATGQRADHIIIAPRAFLPEATAYASFISRSYNVVSRAVAVESIYDAYAFGMFNPEAIKLFLYDATRLWAAPAPQHVLLAGDANYEYKATSAIYGKIFVPSYGFPVSDTWYTTFDALNMHQSMNVGRLPVTSGKDIDAYREKHERYLAVAPDAWNKTTIHFSGGDASQGEQALLQFSTANQDVIDNIVTTPTYAGRARHFYKTVTPFSDFGPYTPTEIRSAIRAGGVLVAYLGHSGTSTWDNSIDTTYQLENDGNRGSLVSDFGCSTGKFAEPYIKCFAEQFVIASQPIAYTGNSSLGFTSTSTTMPRLFYKGILQDGITTLGDAHRVSKELLLQQYGQSAVNRIYVLTNTLIGDPIVKLAIPEKLNLRVSPEWIHPETDVFSDAMDSVAFSVTIANFGRQTGDSVDIRIDDIAGSLLQTSLSLRRSIPALYDTFRIALPTHGVSGQKRLAVTIDPDRLLAEADTSDNRAELPYTVLDTYLKVVGQSTSRSADGVPDIRILNPVVSPGPVSRVIYEFDSTATFASPRTVDGAYGKTESELSPAAFSDGVKWYWRASLDVTAKTWVGPHPFWSGPRRAPFTQRDSAEFRAGEWNSATWRNGGMTLLPAERELRVLSAGALDGGFGSIQLDGVNVLPNTYFRGFYVAVFDSLTMALKRLRVFDTYGVDGADWELLAYMDQVVPGEIAAVATADEPKRRSSTVIPAMRALGSRLIDTLARGPANSAWSFIGWRGAATGSVPETYKPIWNGIAVAVGTFTVVPDTGELRTPLVGPAHRWRSARFVAERPAGTSIRYDVIGSTATGADTLLARIADVDSLDLSAIDAVRFRMLRLAARLIPSPDARAPVLRAWSVDYQQDAELALNYQSVALSRDSVTVGIPLEASVGILNAGDVEADSVAVRVDVAGPDNVVRHSIDYTVPRIAARAWHDTTFTFDTTPLEGACSMTVGVDPGQRVTEQVENNNVYVHAFRVLRDTTRPTLDITLDGLPPVDGDYVSPTPRIVLTLHSATPPGQLSLRNYFVKLDAEKVADSTIMQTLPATGELVYTPWLPAGEHVFDFNAEDAAGNKAFASDYRLRVVVDTVAALSQVVNYPNPFSSQTDFTFIVTGASPPESVELKLYTVSGRLLKTIAMATDRLRVGFNSVRWDGRDEDGDQLANGVYLYKLLVRSGGAPLEVLGKIAVLR